MRRPLGVNESRSATDPRRRVTAGVVAVLLLASAALAPRFAAAQSAVPWWTIDSGGTRSAGGAFAVVGAIGQPDAGVATGGGYVLSGGFFHGGGVVTAVEEPGTGTESHALVFRLMPASPNPVLTRTTLRFELPHSGDALVRVFDVDGRLVRTLLAGALAPGPHALVWDGADERGRRVAAGVHFVRLDFGDSHATQRVVTLR